VNRTEQQTEQTPHDVKQNHIVGGLGDGRLELPIRFRIGCGVIAMWNALQAGVRGALGGALDPPHLPAVVRTSSRSYKAHGASSLALWDRTLK